ncbi:MAG: hypothetical protein WD080_13260 [Egibacteraceae bacterium]
MTDSMKMARRGSVLGLVVAGVLVVAVSAALACVPQRGDLAVENLDNSFASQTGVITGDGGTIPLEWCELLDPGDQAEADEGDEIRVTVSKATQADGCPGSEDRLPDDGTHQVWVSNSGEEWGWSTTDHAPTDKWSIPKGAVQEENEEEPYGCFWDTNDLSDDPRTHDQDTIVNVDANGDGSATFDLDLSQSANSDPQRWDPAVNAANWAAVLCVGDPYYDDFTGIGIFAPLRVTALNSTI